MSDNPGNSLSFQDVKNMSSSQFAKLSKHQLSIALKDAMQATIVKDVPEPKDCYETNLKSLISEAIFEVRRDLLSEQQRLFGLLERRLEERVQKLADQLSVITKEVESQRTTSCSQIENEIYERCQRRSNLIFHGVQEPSSKDKGDQIEHDLYELSAIFKHMNVEVPVQHLKCKRLGSSSESRARLLRVECPNSTMKENILEKRSMLKSFRCKVFIHPDRTKRQQEDYRRLRTELRERRSKGEEVFIRDDKIIHVDRD